MHYALLICGDETAAAAVEYGRALELAPTDAERRYLHRRLRALDR